MLCAVTLAKSSGRVVASRIHPDSARLLLDQTIERYLDPSRRSLWESTIVLVSQRRGRAGRVSGQTSCTASNDVAPTLPYDIAAVSDCAFVLKDTGREMYF